MSDDQQNPPEAPKDAPAFLNVEGTAPQEYSAPKASVLLNLNESNPFEDLFFFLTKPSLYFRSADHLLSIKAERGFFWGKAFFLYFFFSWISSISSLGMKQNVHFQWSLGEESGSLSVFKSFLGENDFSRLGELFQVLYMLFNQAKVFLLPFFALLWILFFARLSAYGLKVIGGIRLERCITRLFYITLVVSYFSVLNFIPSIGLSLATLAGFVYYLVGVKAVSGVSYLRGFFSTYVFFGFGIFLIFVSFSLVALVLAYIGITVFNPF